MTARSLELALTNASVKVFTTPQVVSPEVVDFPV